jgi:hypothetical protein
MRQEGCTYGRINREKIVNLESQMNKIDLKLDSISLENKNMFNHFTERYELMFKGLEKRVPQWVLVIGVIASSIITGLIMFIATGGN